jgi:hypothetical protein
VVVCFIQLLSHPIHFGQLQVSIPHNCVAVLERDDRKRYCRISFLYLRYQEDLNPWLFNLLPRRTGHPHLRPQSLRQLGFPYAYFAYKIWSRALFLNELHFKFIPVSNTFRSLGLRAVPNCCSVFFFNVPPLRLNRRAYTNAHFHQLVYALFLLNFLSTGA